MDKETRKVRTQSLPPYSEARQLLGIYAGTQKAAIVSLHKALMRQAGTPKNPVDWIEPDSWIDQRLSGEDATLARRIWEESDRKINPRHTNGTYSFVNTHKLVETDSFGVYQLMDRGHAFLDEDEVVTRELDEAEGLPQLLEILAAKNRAKRGELVDEWGEYLRGCYEL